MAFTNFYARVRIFFIGFCILAFPSCKTAIRSKNSDSNSAKIMSNSIVSPNYVFDYFYSTLNKSSNLAKDSAERSDAVLFGKELLATYQRYTVNDSLCNEIGSNIQHWLKDGYNIQIQVIGGNWCSDTREGIPKLVKILDKLNFKSSSSLDVIYLPVNRDKQFIEQNRGEFQDYIQDNKKDNVTRVPWVKIVVFKPTAKPVTVIDGSDGSVNTFVGKSDVVVLGEIIEVAYPSWESSILNIVRLR
jgi:hypothetical protein